MDWYYAEDGRQVGPLSEEEFRGAAAAGKVTGETLVWREGMEEWKAFGDLPARHRLGAASGPGPDPVSVPAQVTCAECGASVPQEDAIAFGASRVCAHCKPLFIQRIKEGGSLAVEIEYAGVGIRSAALLIDMVLISVLYMSVGGLVSALTGQDFETLIDGSQLFAVLVVPLTALETYLIYKFEGTPGKTMLGIRIVGADGAHVSLKQALMRSMFSTLLTAVPVIGAPLYVAECLKAAFNPERRALHDDVCATRVVRRT